MDGSVKSQISRLIKQQASKLGFLHCGISKATFLEEEASRLEDWLNKNHQGKMAYMANHFDKRLDPRLLVEGAKSVVSLTLNYYTDELQQDVNAPKLSKYAYGKDYHHVIKAKLKSLVQFLEEHIGAFNHRGFVDSAPVMDKVWAKKAGIGWIGKHSNLLTRTNGSYFFIAELIMDVELEYDEPFAFDHCGTCTRCIDACPTDAIEEPYVVNGSKCISYFTIELKGEIPSNNTGKFDNWMFGCDICQEVCPWNRFSSKHSEPDFEPHPDLLGMTLGDWNNLKKEKFNEVFRKSAVKRTGYDGLQRNIKFLNIDND